MTENRDEEADEDGNKKKNNWDNPTKETTNIPD
jgi:hypothetical protein